MSRDLRIDKICDALTPLEKIKAVVLQIRRATYGIGSAARTIDHWGSDIEPLDPRWRKTGGAA